MCTRLVFVDGCVCRSLGQFSILFGQVVRGMSAGARVFEYMDLRPGMPVRGGMVLPNNDIQGEVKFKDVTFAYPTRKEQVCCPFACGCMSVWFGYGGEAFLSLCACACMHVRVLVNLIIHLPLLHTAGGSGWFLSDDPSW